MSSRHHHERNKEKERLHAEARRILSGQIVLVSTYGINCGIATYTRYLLDELNKISPVARCGHSATGGHGLFTVQCINSGIPRRLVGGILHFQHEFGIIPSIPKIEGKVILTWHTVSSHTVDAVKEFEDKCNVVAHIVHDYQAYKFIESNKDIFVVPHGSVIIDQMTKEDARKQLGIGNEENIINNHDMPIGLVFGFQSRDKKYDELIDVARRSGIHLIVSGALHNLKTDDDRISIENSDNVTFLNRYLAENEVNLYALASDLLLFDYEGKKHYSVSGAMHRVIGAGRPVICSDIRHFSDLRNGENCLKFKDGDIGELERCIKIGLENNEKFGLAARIYAQDTSWDKVAMMHINIYRRYMDI